MSVRQFAVLVLWRLQVLVVRFSLEIVLHFDGHSDLAHQRWKFLAVFRQHDGSVQRGQVLHLPHEENVSSSRHQPFLLPLLRFFYDVFVGAVYFVGAGPAHWTVTVPFHWLPVEILPFLLFHVRREEHRVELHGRGGML